MHKAEEFTFISAQKTESFSEFNGDGIMGLCHKNLFGEANVHFIDALYEQKTI